MPTLRGELKSIRGLITVCCLLGMTLSCTRVVVKDTIRFDRKESTSRVDRKEQPLTWNARSDANMIELDAVFQDTCTPVNTVNYDRVRERKKDLKLSGGDIAMASIFGAAGTGLLTWGLLDDNLGGKNTGVGGLTVGLSYAIFLGVQAIRAIDRQETLGQEVREEPQVSYTCNRELDATPVELIAGDQRVRLTQNPADKKSFRRPVGEVPPEFLKALRLRGSKVDLAVNGQRVGDADLSGLHDASWFGQCVSEPAAGCREYLRLCKLCTHKTQAEETLAATEMEKQEAVFEQAVSPSWESLSSYLLACRRFKACRHKEEALSKLRGMTGTSTPRLAFLWAQCTRWAHLGKPLCQDDLVEALAGEIELAVRAKDIAKAQVRVVGWSSSKNRHYWDVPAPLRVEGKELRYIEAHRASWTTGQAFEVIYVNKSAFTVRAQLVLQCYLLGQYHRIGMGEVTLAPGEMKSKGASTGTFWGELTALHGCSYDSLLVDIIE